MAYLLLRVLMVLPLSLLKKINLSYDYQHQQRYVGLNSVSCLDVSLMHSGALVFLERGIFKSTSSFVSFNFSFNLYANWQSTVFYKYV